MNTKSLVTTACSTATLVLYTTRKASKYSKHL